MSPDLTTADEIAALSEAKWRWSTDGELERLADLFDDELVFVHLDGHITSKHEWIGELRSRRFVYDRIDTHEASTRVFGDAAAVVGRATFTVNGGSVFDLVCTEMYVRRGTDWKLVSLHACSDATT